MKKVTVIALAIALLTVCFVAPVMAEPTKGQKVAVTSIYIPPSETRSESEGKMTNGGILTFKGLVEVFPNNLLIIGNDPPLTVFAYQAGDGCWNTKTEVMMIRYDTIVYYIPNEGSPDGFSGNQEMKLFGWDPATYLWDSMTVHCVLHGFGAYAGQTLMLSYEGQISVFMYGYCLKG